MNPKTELFISNVKLYILNPIIGLMFAVAVVVFIYGVAEFILGADNEDKRDIGKKHMIWGIIGMFVMVSAYGIITLLENTWKGVS